MLAGAHQAPLLLAGTLPQACGRADDPADVKQPGHSLHGCTRRCPDGMGLWRQINGESTTRPAYGYTAPHSCHPRHLAHGSSLVAWVTHFMAAPGAAVMAHTSVEARFAVADGSCRPTTTPAHRQSSYGALPRRLPQKQPANTARSLCTMPMRLACQTISASPVLEERALAMSRLNS